MRVHGSILIPRRIPALRSVERPSNDVTEAGRSLLACLAICLLGNKLVKLRWILTNVLRTVRSKLLPNRDEAYIPLPKLTEYLLSETHAVGRFKAEFFRAHGFDAANWSALEQGLLNIARTEKVVEKTWPPFGEKYVVEGYLASSQSDSIRIRTVWIIEGSDDRPRFVTAYPA
jgi:hypothetical protein